MSVERVGLCVGVFVRSSVHLCVRVRSWGAGTTQGEAIAVAVDWLGSAMTSMSKQQQAGLTPTYRAGVSWPWICGRTGSLAPSLKLLCPLGTAPYFVTRILYLGTPGYF